MCVFRRFFGKKRSAYLQIYIILVVRTGLYVQADIYVIVIGSIIGKLIEVDNRLIDLFVGVVIELSEVEIIFVIVVKSCGPGRRRRF